MKMPLNPPSRATHATVLMLPAIRAHSASAVHGILVRGHEREFTNECRIDLCFVSSRKCGIWFVNASLGHVGSCMNMR